jgi:hypothetical protein
MPKIVGFSNYFVDAQSTLPMGVNVEFIFLVFASDNGLENLLYCRVEVFFIRCAISTPDGSS